MGFIGTLQKSRFWWVKVEVEAGSSIGALAEKAQALLSVGRCRVANSEGQILPGTETGFLLRNLIYEVTIIRKPYYLL